MSGLSTERFLWKIASAYDERKLTAIVSYFCAKEDVVFSNKYEGQNGLDSSFPLRILYCVRHRRPTKIDCLTKAETEAFYALFDEIYRQNSDFLRVVFAR